jgi:hypothetical protein
LKMPVPSVSAYWNGARHFAHLALMSGSPLKKDWHDVELKPAEHAAFASARSDDPQSPLVTESTGVVTVDPHPPYVAGHVVVDSHTRGVVEMSHVVIVVVQSTHEAPPEPHRVSRNPAKQVPVKQQPGHDIAVHVGLQTPPLHTSLVIVQSVHAAPPVPHWVFDSLVTHMSPAQQPVAQLAALQSGGVATQVPVASLQNSFWRAQLVHARPPVPHCVSLSIGTHVAPAQQPMQFIGPHGAATQVCELGLHSSPVDVQLMHASPPTPHASDDTPDTHTVCPLLVVQHPLAQVLALQVGWIVAHAWSWTSQKSKPSAWQSLHALPPNPQVLSSLPSLQVPDGVQHPVGHVVGLQAPPSPFGPPSP